MIAWQFATVAATVALDCGCPIPPGFVACAVVPEPENIQIPLIGSPLDAAFVQSPIRELPQGQEQRSRGFAFIAARSIGIGLEREAAVFIDRVPHRR